MAESWVINSEASKTAFKKNLDDLFEKHHFITYGPPRIGADRSMDQNALLQVWVREYIAHRLQKHVSHVTEGELEGTKLIIKKQFTAAHPDCYYFMVFELVNIYNGTTKKEYTSSSSWKRGEMFMVLTWFQMIAAQDGLILEAKGQYAKLQRESNGEGS